ncbi:MAG: hypothetical protein EF813_08645 [Methanosarcinales archaeon]|nr:MAG: hypothetical protein EF813_08645 [Methanosarcinales archaeon]
MNINEISETLKSIIKNTAEKLSGFKRRTYIAEISLHPGSQVLLTELFAEAIAEGKQIIITTHSEFLPLALRRPIKNGLLALDAIALYHVMKDEGGTTAEKLDLTEDGYVRGWIPSFAEIEDDLLGEWTETVPED